MYGLGRSTAKHCCCFGMPTIREYRFELSHKGVFFYQAYSKQGKALYIYIYMYMSMCMPMSMRLFVSETKSKTMSMLQTIPMHVSVCLYVYASMYR